MLEHQPGVFTFLWLATEMTFAHPLSEIEEMKTLQPLFIAEIKQKQLKESKYYN